MSFKLAGVDHAPLFASWEDTPDWPTDGRLVYAYHRPFPGVEWNDYIKLVIPFASFTKTEADAGLSFCTDLAFPVLPMRITARQADACTHVEIERPLVRLEPNAAVTLVHYIAPHDGDVRSGLRWLRETYDRSATEIRDHLCARMDAYTQREIPEDDMALIVAKITPLEQQEL